MAERRTENENDSYNVTAENLHIGDVQHQVVQHQTVVVHQHLHRQQEASPVDTESDAPTTSKSGYQQGANADEFYEVVRKIPNKRWKEFARVKLNLPEDVIDNIEVDYEKNIQITDAHQPTNLPGIEKLNQEGERLLQAVDQIKKHQLAKLGPDVVAYSEELQKAKIPDVGQTLIEIDIYKGLNEENELQPIIKKTHNDVSKHLNFQELVSSFKEQKEEGIFLALFGPAGSGKTTLSKKLCRHLTTEDYLVLHFQLMHLNYGEKQITLQELLLDNQFIGASKETLSLVFQWMIKNPEKCAFVFDGLDQATWTLENMAPVNIKFDASLSVPQLVANLCSRQFFPESMLIFTSRSHSLLAIPLGLRPKRTIYVSDLSGKDAKALFYCYAEDKADELWLKFETKSPQLLDLCRNPMLLQFIVYAGLFGDVNHISTITNVFDTVLQQLGHSQHAKGKKLDDLKLPLGKMAYEGMARKTVLFTQDDLRKVGLEDVKVQDVVIKMAKFSWLPNRKMFDGADALFYFMHQLLQEVFGAHYIALFMPDEEFDQIVDDLIENPHWATTRRFVCGLLFGQKSASREGYNETCLGPSCSYSTLSCTTNRRNQEIFPSNFAKVEPKGSRRFFKNTFKKGTRGDKFLKQLSKFLREKHDDRWYLQGQALQDFLGDLQEMQEQYRDKIALSCPEELNLNRVPLKPSECFALADFLPRIQKRDLWLMLNSCQLNGESFNIISDGILKMNHKLGAIGLNQNEFEKKDVESICRILGKVKKFYLTNCGLDSESMRIVREKWKTLQHPTKVRGLKQSSDTTAASLLGR